MNCYFMYDFGEGTEIDDHGNTGACTPASGDQIVQCCDVGDTCRSNGVCEYSGKDTGGSGFYLAGCTDPAFKDPACVNHCTSTRNSDVVYDYTTGNWECCGSNSTGARECGSPEGPSFTAPAPANLGFVATVIATNSALPLATAVPVLSSSTAAATIPAATSPNGADTPSSGTTSVGVVVGATLGGLLGLALLTIAALLWRARRLGKRKHGASAANTAAGSAPPGRSAGPLGANMQMPEPIALEPFGGEQNKQIQQEREQQQRLLQKDSQPPTETRQIEGQQPLVTAPSKSKNSADQLAEGSNPPISDSTIEYYAPNARTLR